MHCHDNVSDQYSTYYVVPDPNLRAGLNAATLNGNGYGKRPPPAPTTIPIDDDFDAYTLENQETVYGECERDVDNRSSAGTGAGVHPEYGRYMDEMGKVFGSDVDVEVTLRRARSPSRKSMGRLKEIQDGLRRESSLTSLRRHQAAERESTGKDARATHRRGSSEPQPVELVHGRVVEDGSERAVKTWREEVAKNTTLAESASNVAGRGDAFAHGSTRSYRLNQKHAALNDPRMFDSPRRAVSQIIGSSLGRNVQSQQTYSPRQGRMYTAADHNEAAAGAQRRPPSPCRSERIYTMAELKALAAVSYLSQEVKSSPRSERLYSASELRSNEFTPSTGQRASKRDSPPRNTNTASGGYRTRMSPKSKSNSQESGAKVSSLSSVEAVLASCQPSLLHLAPILGNLGVRKVEHLRAAARLDGETRDRELKDEALKQGVTVMEWAILMDRIQSI